MSKNVWPAGSDGRNRIGVHRHPQPTPTVRFQLTITEGPELGRVVECVLTNDEAAQLSTALASCAARNLSDVRLAEAKQRNNL